MGETLSVVVPVYNVEKYLSRALDSILQQTYPVYEIICVDDGSTDSSLDILQEYAKKDNRIKVIHKENGGLVSARKAGIAKASGTYAAYVDSDDFIEPNMYEEMMELATKNDADMVTSGFIRDYGNSITMNTEKMKPGVYSDVHHCKEFLGKLIDRESFYQTYISPSVCNKIFRTSKLQEVQAKVDNRITAGEDDAVTYPFLFRCDRVVVSGACYYHYCIRETGSVLGTKKNNDEAMAVLLNYLEQEFLIADADELALSSQYRILKTYYNLLRDASHELKYNRGILYPFGLINKKDKILLYGAGKFGVEMKEYLEQQGFQIAAWADKSANRPGVIRPNDISKVDYDRVIIAVLIADAVEHIKRDLNELHVPEGKILFVDTEYIA